MPGKVPNVAWKCPQCGKRKWLKPAEAKVRRFCTRACQYKGQRVEKPVREKAGQKLARYGLRQCPLCSESFEAKSPVQIYCSQACSVSNAQACRRGEQPLPTACEVCGEIFVPRKGSAGRFCSRKCNFAGTKGKHSPQWQGGRAVRTDGYILVRAEGHPYAQKNHGYVPEHRLVMEQVIGRHLDPTETVHHINGQRDDNRPENLQLRNGNHGKGAAFKCLDCGSTNVVAVKLVS